MEQSLAQIYKENLMIMTQSLEQYKNQMILFQKKYDMLREDYLYNLRVINERDEELRKCDSQISLLNSVQLSSEYHFIDSCIDERERKGVSESNLWQLTDSVSKIASLQQSVKAVEATVRQHDQEHQIAVTRLQQQVEASRHQNEVMRTNVELEVRRRLTEETSRLQGEIQQRETRIREAEAKSHQLEVSLTQLRSTQASTEGECTRLRTSLEEQKRTQVALTQKVTESEARAQALEQQIQVQNSSIEELRQHLNQSQADASHRLQECCHKEMMCSQKRENQRQSAAYEQQIKALRSHLDQVSSREQQRISAIRNRVHLM
ncbi:hypothetical protein JH06_3901 [Blastocystis sp. subtype 4]|uniref:hypothetical protein n=1 Tax=Blastocystis sp. subtype 4 TaxID=944170 RepID=UPI00071169B7|nr:hypothetical protein JH06_3901 [Blastocystis sp. subtype 4]KNB42574.1 hypothetical protein JH06_3901 [Blastocystis sp. subtype 4]|eukprot:XP_014526017.1 hypothetical protein JH06_3901 [Blastocystis sp. subtype 4]